MRAMISIAVLLVAVASFAGGKYNVTKDKGTMATLMKEVLPLLSADLKKLVLEDWAVNGAAGSTALQAYAKVEGDTCEINFEFPQKVGAYSYPLKFKLSDLKNPPAHAYPVDVLNFCEQSSAQ